MVRRGNWFPILAVLLTSVILWTVLQTPFLLATVKPLFWHRTVCIIRSNNVERVTEDGAIGIYRVRVQYAYRYRTNTFIGSRFHMMPIRYCGDKESAEAIQRRYSVGRSLECFVNPANPAEAVLERALNLDDMYFVLRWSADMIGVKAGVTFVCSLAIAYAVFVIRYWRLRYRERRKHSTT